jgi:hypothetical protein
MLFQVSHVCGVTMIVYFCVGIQENGGDNDLLSFIIGKRKCELSPSILVIKNFN